MPDLMTTYTVAPYLGYTRRMVIWLTNCGILPYQRIGEYRVFTPADVRVFRRRMRALKRAGATLKAWRTVPEAVAAK